MGPMQMQWHMIGGMNLVYNSLCFQKLEVKPGDYESYCPCSAYSLRPKKINLVKNVISPSTINLDSPLSRFIVLKKNVTSSSRCFLDGGSMQFNSEVNFSIMVRIK